MAMVMCGFLCTGLLIICSEEGPIDDPGQCKENQAEHGALPGTGREPRENRLRQIPELKNFCRDRNKTNLEGDPRDAGDNKTADPHRDHQHGVERDRSTIYQRFVDVEHAGDNTGFAHQTKAFGLRKEAEHDRKRERRTATTDRHDPGDLINMNVRRSQTSSWSGCDEHSCL